MKFSPSNIILLYKNVFLTPETNCNNLQKNELLLLKAISKIPRNFKFYQNKEKAGWHIFMHLCVCNAFVIQIHHVLPSKSIKTTMFSWLVLLIFSVLRRTVPNVMHCVKYLHSFATFFFNVTAHLSWAGEGQDKDRERSPSPVTVLGKTDSSGRN